MSEPTSDFCAAYACPLLGVYGVSSKWYCCCHFNVEPSLNDAITAELHRQKDMVDRVLLARRSGRPDSQLEDGLIQLTREITGQKPIQAGVIGPEHAAPHFAEPNRVE